MIGYRLSLERRRLKLNQAQVADLLGMSRSMVSMLETDQTPLDVERLLTLAESGFDVMKVLTDEPAKVAAGRLLNWELCLSITEHVDAWCQSRGIEFAPDKKAIVVKHLYLQFATRDQVEESALKEVLKMAA